MAFSLLQTVHLVLYYCMAISLLQTVHLVLYYYMAISLLQTVHLVLKDLTLAQQYRHLIHNTGTDWVFLFCVSLTATGLDNGKTNLLDFLWLFICWISCGMI